MANISFSLLNIQRYPDKPLPIYLRYPIKGDKPLERSLGKDILVHPKDWDKKRQLVKSSDPAHEVLNALLDKIKSQLRQEYLRITLSGRQPTRQMMNDKFEEIMGRGKRSDVHYTLLTYAQKRWPEIKAAAEKRGKASNTRVQNVAGTLERFTEVYSGSFHFDDLDKRFAIDLLDFLIGENQSHGYIRELFKGIRQCVREANELGVTRNAWMLSYKVNLPGKGKTKVFLELEELLQLYRFDAGSAYLNRQKDCLVFACLSGLRYENWKDVDQSKMLSVEAGGMAYLEMPVTAKDSPQAFIPLFYPVKKILERYDGKLPVRPRRKTNEFIKKAAKAAGINKAVNIRDPRGGKIQTYQAEKWQELSTHSGRRTMTHLLGMEGLAEKYINIICGWTGEKTMAQHYDHSTFKQIASRKAFYEPVQRLALKLQPEQETFLMF